MLTHVTLLRCCACAGLLALAIKGDAAHAADTATTTGAAEASSGWVPSMALQPPPRGEAARTQPIVLRARVLSTTPGVSAMAEGDVEFRRGGLLINADRFSYDTPTDLARASGKVRVVRDGAVYSGPALELKVQRFEGFFLEPRFDFPLLGAGGRADRIDFADSNRATALNATYTSCPRDGPEAPAWVLKARSVVLDTGINEGRAEGAVLQFLGTPILAWPSLTFPLGDQRKSGWLPPSINIDNRSGVEVAVPYYWNIAPNRDATLVPRIITRRGLGVDAEFRYLELRDQGSVSVDWLPNDRVAKRSREALRWTHEGRSSGTPAAIGEPGLRYRVDVVRVSDDDWWKDFPNAGRSFTTRLLPLRAAVEQDFTLPLPGAGAGAEVRGLAYARLLGWQVLQASDSSFASPYQRSPQVGAQLHASLGAWQFSGEAEFNRFTLPGGSASRAGRPQGERLHVLAGVSVPYRESGLWVVPRLALNAASYDTRQESGERNQATRAIPSFSVDAGMAFERPLQAFGRTLSQTLEPRLLYVNTPFRAQSQLPNYDAAAKDFNLGSIYTDNAFSGVDRVADAHQITGGFTSRFIDPSSGAEVLRVGVAQRYLLRNQRVAPQTDGTPDGPALQQRLSDLLLNASTTVIPSWSLESAVQYSADSSRTVRSLIGARYSPGPFRTVNATYRLARGLNEQIEVGWQWPVAGIVASPAAQANANRPAVVARGGACSGTWYAVGRVNYSLNDSRVTDSLIGLEYDAGCWIGRFVAERLSTGRSEATTRLMFQLELVGFSRLGSNPLRVLKDNIPGYRLLREERGNTPRTDEWQPPD